MAAPGTSRKQGRVQLSFVDGARRAFPRKLKILLRVVDGYSRVVYSDFVRSPTIALSVPLSGNARDWYTIVAHADGYRDAAAGPMHVAFGKTAAADLMLVPKDAGFHFPPLDTLRRTHSLLYTLLTNGVDPDAAPARYADAMEHRPAELGALLTIGAAIAAIPLPGADRLNPLQYYWELEWDLLMQDRFWAWTDAALADEIAETARLNAFAAEPDPGLWHPGIPGRIHPATRSWKQTRFDFANVQLTFHESDEREIGGRRCVIVEPDIDCYKDLLAHGLLEVIPNWLTQDKTNPEVVYALRWMAGRHEELNDFDPPCTLEA